MRISIFTSMAIITLSVAAAGADDHFDIAKAAVTERLKDPESARFTGLQMSADGKVVCGKVNAKNSYGGYVGPQPFRYFVEKKMAIIVDREGISTVYLDSMAQPISICP